MVEVEHLVKFYGEKEALTDVSFSIPEGQVVGLLGLNGVNVHKVQILTYVISGLFSAFAGMLGAAYMTSARCQMFDEYAYNSLIAVIIGGTTLSGGVGTYTGSIAGSLVMILLSNMLTTVGMAQPVRNICMGAVLILLLALYNREKNVRQ